MIIIAKKIFTIFITTMIINKLTPSVKLPLDMIRGSFQQRQVKADNLTKLLFENISSKVKDDYTIFSYGQLQKHIDDILPAKNLKIIIQNLSDSSQAGYYGECETLFNANRDIRAISINLSGIENTIRSAYIPVLVHEFQHVSDNIFHPKFLSRLQSLNKKNLMSKKYDDFYDKYYYCDEYIESKRDKKDVLKIIKNKTQKFLRGFAVSDKMDFIQDMRYSLMSELKAYQEEEISAQKLKSKGILMKDYNFEDYPKAGLFKEKVKLLEDLAIEYIKKERSKHASHLNRPNKNV